MKLIPLEEIEKIWRLKHTPELMVVDPEWQYISLNNIYYIPTIDPIAIIDEMIEENRYEVYMDKETTHTEIEYGILWELKSRLSTNL